MEIFFSAFSATSTYTYCFFLFPTFRGLGWIAQKICAFHFRALFLFLPVGMEIECFMPGRRGRKWDFLTGSHFFSFFALGLESEFSVKIDFFCAYLFIICNKFFKTPILLSLVRKEFAIRKSNFAINMLFLVYEAYFFAWERDWH